MSSCPCPYISTTSIFLQYGTPVITTLTLEMFKPSQSAMSYHISHIVLSRLFRFSAFIAQLSDLYGTRTKCVTQIAIFEYVHYTLHLHPGFNLNLSQQYGLSRITIQTSPAVEINIFHQSTWDVTIPFMDPTRTCPFCKHYKDYI